MYISGRNYSHRLLAPAGFIILLPSGRDTLHPPLDLDPYGAGLFVFTMLAFGTFGGSHKFFGGGAGI